MRATYPTTTPDEDHVAAIVDRTGVTESEAWEILARERGEIDGDVAGFELGNAD